MKLTRSYLFTKLKGPFKLLLIIGEVVAVVITITAGIYALKSNATILWIGVVFLAAILVVIIFILKMTYSPISLFKCQSISFEWQIDEKGANSTTKATRTLIALSNNQKYYKLKNLFTSGKILELSSEGPVKLLPIYEGAVEGRIHSLMVEFYTPLQKGQKIKFSIIKKTKDTFLNSTEFVRVRIGHETEKFSMLVKFPTDKGVKKWWPSHYHGQSPQVFNEAELSEKEDSGRKVVSWRKSKNILLNDEYCINWEW